MKEIKWIISATRKSVGFLLYYLPEIEADDDFCHLSLRYILKVSCVSGAKISSGLSTCFAMPCSNE